MNCAHHPERGAVSTCTGCGGGVCEFCRTVVEGKTYCPPCVDKMLTSPAKAASTPVGQPFVAATGVPKANPSAPSRTGTAAPYAARSAGAPALAGGVVEGGSRLSALWMFIVSACGALAMAAVFMPWMRFTEWPFTFSISGWQATSLDTLVGINGIEPYLVIAGAAIMLACALPATVLVFTSTESQDTVRTLARFSMSGVGIVLGVIIWVIVDLMGEAEISISYGVWIILVSSLVGLVASALMSRWGGGQSRFYLRND